MKNTLIALLLLFTVAGCLPEKKKDADITPEPDVAGTYQVSLITVGTQTVSYPNSAGSSATAVVTKVSDTQIGMILNEVIRGVSTPTDLGTFTIKKATGQNYDIINASNARIGNVNGTDLLLDFVSSGQRVVLISRK